MHASLALFGLALSFVTPPSFFTTFPQAPGNPSNFSTPQLNFSAPQFLVLCPLCICEQLLSGARNKGIGDRLTQQNFLAARPPSSSSSCITFGPAGLGIGHCCEDRRLYPKTSILRYRLRRRLNRIDPEPSSPLAREPNSLLLLGRTGNHAADAPLTSPPPRQLATWLSRRRFRRRLLALPEVRRKICCALFLFLLGWRGNCRCQRIGMRQ